MGRRWGEARRKRFGRRALGALLPCLALLAVALPSANASAAPRKVAKSPAAATSSFGLDLLGKLPAGNAVISPDSIATALAMAGTGARAATAKQMAEVLHLKGPSRFDSIGGLQHRIFAAAAEAGAGNPAAPTLTIANGLFVQSGYPLEPAFVAGLGEHFGATPETVDFLTDPAAATAAINAWADAHTNGVIPKLFDELPPETRLVLANAVYLKAKWRHEFEASDTSKAPFHRPGGEVTTEFMHQQNRFPYAAGPGYKAVDLPYAGSKLSLLAVLPTTGSVGGLEARLRKSGLAPVVNALAPANVELTLPRFHLNTEAELGSALEALGMKAPFGETADFSGISGNRELKIGVVRHIADIKVNEEGTEAAAVTGVGVVATAAPAIPPDLVPFKANRPFLFFVRDDATGAVLFAGRLTDPQGT
jgi:serpin B